MRRLLLLTLALAACRNEPAPRAIESPCRERAFEGSAFVVCDPGQGALRLYAADGEEAAKRRFADLGLAPDTVAFAMNAGMFDEDGRPIGLAIVDGKEVHKINRREGGGNFHLMPNGVFAVNADGRAAIETSAEWRDERAVLATQSGPMLVIDGKLHPKIAPDGESRYVRNAVGVTADGRPLFVMTLDAVSLGKLARFFRDALKTPDALFLDGSVSSLWDPANGRMDAFTELGPIIVALRPGESAPRRAARATL